MWDKNDVIRDESTSDTRDTFENDDKLDVYEKDLRYVKAGFDEGGGEGGDSRWRLKEDSRDNGLTIPAYIPCRLTT